MDTGRQSLGTFRHRRNRKVNKGPAPYKYQREKHLSWCRPTSPKKGTSSNLPRVFLMAYAPILCTVSLKWRGQVANTTLWKKVQSSVNSDRPQKHRVPVCADLKVAQVCLQYCLHVHILLRFATVQVASLQVRSHLRGGISPCGETTSMLE